MSLEFILSAVLLLWSVRWQSAVTGGSCPGNTESFSAGSNQRCFQIGPESDKVTFDNYEKKCNALGGKTLTVDSPEVVTFLNSIGKSKLSDYWIGAVMSKGYIWTHTGEEVTENLWKKAKSAEKEAEDCVALKDGQWELMDCDEKGVDNYVCETETTLIECMQQKANYYEPSMSIQLCVKIFTGNDIRQEVAETNCKNKFLGGRLARIDNPSVTSRKDFKPKERYWIGMKLANTDNFKDWHWSSTGESLNFTNWKDEPDDENKRCAFAKRGDGDKWFAASCSAKYTWVCEVNASALANPVIMIDGKTSASYIVNEGETFALTCTKGPGGTNPDSWMWLKNGNAFTADVKGQTFSKTAVTGDTGSYTCKALVGGVTSPLSAELTLTVIRAAAANMPPLNGAPMRAVDAMPRAVDAIDATSTLTQPVIFKDGAPKSTVTVNEGATISLKCFSPPWGTPGSWKWFKDNRLLGGDTAKLFKRTAAVAGDAGSFTCQALKGVLASPLSKALILTVKVQCQIDVYGRKYKKFKDKMLANTHLTRISHNSRSVLNCITTCLNLHQCDCSAVEYNSSTWTCTMVKAAALAGQSQANAPGVDLLLLK